MGLLSALCLMLCAQEVARVAGVLLAGAVLVSSERAKNDRVGTASRVSRKLELVRRKLRGQCLLLTTTFAHTGHSHRTRLAPTGMATTDIRSADGACPRAALLTVFALRYRPEGSDDYSCEQEALHFYKWRIP